MQPHLAYSGYTALLEIFIRRSSLAVRFTPSVNLKPLHFEVPGFSSDWLFTGREWLFQEVDASLRSDDPATSQGVVIIGNMGFGKTSIIARLVALSCHGCHMWPSTAGAQLTPQRKQTETQKHISTSVCIIQYMMLRGHR